MLSRAGIALAVPAPCRPFICSARVDCIIEAPPALPTFEPRLSAARDKPQRQAGGKCSNVMILCRGTALQVFPDDHGPP